MNLVKLEHNSQLVPFIIELECYLTHWVHKHREEDVTRPAYLVLSNTPQWVQNLGSGQYNLIETFTSGQSPKPFAVPLTRPP